MTINGLKYRSLLMTNESSPRGTYRRSYRHGKRTNLNTSGDLRRAPQLLLGIFLRGELPLVLSGKLFLMAHQIPILLPQRPAIGFTA